MLLAARKATPSHRQAGVVSTGQMGFKQQQNIACHQHAYTSPNLDLSPVAADAARVLCKATRLRTPQCAELQLHVGSRFPELEAACPHLLKHAERRAHGRHLLPRAAAR